MASYLKQLSDKGISTYVIPGNHDVNNPDAARYLPSGSKERVDTVSPAEFASIYADAGYGKALSRDPGSLSYAAEVAPRLWLLALDSAQYEHNLQRGRTETSGAIRPQTYQWMVGILEKAKQAGVAVIAAEHHPLMEHFAGMKDKYPEYIVNDNWKLVTLLSEYGVSLAFSGHYHASSIVQHAEKDGACLTDVETGSLVTWPCSYRLVTVPPQGAGSVEIHTMRISQIASYAAKGEDFSVEGKRVIGNGIGNIAKSTMLRYHVSEKDRDAIAPAIVSAMMAHYAGDAHFEV
jgi:3',5'-cyclic AMP phosphodiesterase CpdA